MKFGTTANSQQVNAMALVVSRYCKHLGIDRDTPEAEQIASVVVELHAAGLRGETELLKALIVPSGRMPRGPH